MSWDPCLWVSHFRNVTEPSGFVILVRDTMLVSDWKEYILDSVSWSIERRVDLIDMLSSAMMTFEVRQSELLDPHYNAEYRCCRALNPISRRTLSNDLPSSAF